jgi:nitrile hydratase beta subunit
MNGAHDLGGMHGFGPVVREENEPVFHADWERTVYAVTGAVRAQRLVNIDEFRHGIERMPPAEYLASSYYARWLSGVQRLLIEKGVVTEEELGARVGLLRDNPNTPLPRREDPALIERLRPRTSRPSYEREGAAPRFQVGDQVITRNVHPRGHTRLPRYARAKRGVIHASHGCHVFPDAHAHGLGEQPQPLYTVRFEARELWTDSAEPNQLVHLDLWEPYLTSPQSEPRG